MISRVVRLRRRRQSEDSEDELEDSEDELEAAESLELLFVALSEVEVVDDPSVDDPSDDDFEEASELPEDDRLSVL